MNAAPEPEPDGEQDNPEITDPGRRRRRIPPEALQPPAIANSVAPAEELVLGIDFGTTHCRVAVFVGGEARLVPLSPDGQSFSMPSVIAHDDQGQVLVGARAANTVPAIRLKLARPSDEPVELRGHLLTFLREAAQAWAGRPIGKAVLSVPAGFNDRQRAALLKAGELAGLEVIRVVNEPSAAALAFGFGRGLARKRVLVCDLGGGSFEASLLEITGDDLDVVSSVSAPQLGGVEFDRRIADELRRAIEAELHAAPGTTPDGLLRVLDAAEQAKIQLSDAESTEVHVPFAAAREDGTPMDFRSTLTRETVDQLTSELVDGAVDTARALLAAANVSAQSVDEVLLVGGQSRAPLVRRRLEEALGRPARDDIDFQAAVVLGAAVLGHSILRQKSARPGARISDILTVPISVGLRGGALLRVLDRQTRLPAHKSLSFPVKAGEALALAVLQGDGARAEGCELLGVARLKAERDGEARLQVRVTEDGRVEVGARAPGARDEVALGLPEVAVDLEQLLADAPAPIEPDEAASERGLLGGIRRLFGRR